MKPVEPSVYLIAEPALRWDEIEAYLEQVGGEEWIDSHITADVLPHENNAESLVEFMGKLCYRSWKPGLNPNVSKVRGDQAAYIANILSVKHGSVLEHANFSFVFYGVSRVFTHELVRHRAGSAFSQESMRFVRLEDIPFWFPDWAKEDSQVYERGKAVIDSLESFQKSLAKHFELDKEGVDFHTKKAMTSFMRRFAPDGVGTSIGWTANVRTLRHVIEARTNEGAEEEIRLVFDKVVRLLIDTHPYFFGDFEQNDKGEWVPTLGSKP